jgi:hypothetical protein
MGTTQSGKLMGIWEGSGKWGRKESDGTGDVRRKGQGGEGLGKAVAVKVAEVQNMARLVLRIALVLWLSGQHLNRRCNSGEATK